MLFFVLLVFATFFFLIVFSVHFFFLGFWQLGLAGRKKWILCWMGMGWRVFLVLSFFLIVDIALSLSPRFFFTSSAGAFESICSFFYLLIFTSSFFCCCWATLIPRDIGVCLHTCVFFSVFAADPLIWMAICNGDGCGWGLCLAFTFMCNVHAFVWRI